MRRRRALGLLVGGAAGSLLGGSAGAIGPRSQVRLAQVLYGGNALPRPTGLSRLSWEVEKRTSIDVALEPRELRLGDRDLFRHPFLYLGGDQAFPAFPDDQLERLRRFLVYGGFMLVDSADARPGGPFDQSVRKLVKALFPRDPMTRLASDHTVFKSFYLLSTAVGRTATVPYLEGVDRDERTLLLYSQNDLAGAWARDNFGQWEHPVYPGGERQRELAIRWGVNILMYALCLNYKADQVHIPFILKRRRWKVE